MPNDDLNDDAQDPNEPESIRNLRAHARKLEKELKESGDARKELAMLKAGVDTNSPLGKFFAENFKGDPSDIEGIKAQAEAIGAISPVKDEPAEKPADTSDTSTQERQDLANGAMPNDASGIDPRQSSLDKANDMLAKGAPFDVAAGEMLAERAQAAMAGDQRVQFKGKAF